MYLYVWEFEVAPGSEAEFERAYGPEGAWVQLFRRAPGYRSTRLLRTGRDPARYVTLDEWEGWAQYDHFRRVFAEEYAALDRRCEPLTIVERLRLDVEGPEVR